MTVTGGSGTPGTWGTDTEIDGTVTVGGLSSGAGSAGVGACTCAGAAADVGAAGGLATGVAGGSALRVCDGRTLGPAGGVRGTDGARRA